jgi:hypothetical protein
MDEIIEAIKKVLENPNTFEEDKVSLRQSLAGYEKTFEALLIKIRKLV